MLDIPLPLLTHRRRIGPLERTWPMFMPRLSMIPRCQSLRGMPLLQPSAGREVPRARSVPVTSPTRGIALWNRPPAPRSAGNKPQDPPEPHRQSQGCDSAC